MPFMMPLMLDQKKKALIISPLKILQADQVSQLSTPSLTTQLLHLLQVSRFDKAKVSAVAVNGESWSTKLLQVRGSFSSGDH